MKEVSGDKGYISTKNLKATEAHGATPFIPFKVNAQADRGTDVWSRMFFFYNFKRENFWPTTTSGQTSKRPSA